MASMWRKAMLYLGLGPDDEYDDFDVTGEHQRAVAARPAARRPGGEGQHDPEPSGSVRTLSPSADDEVNGREVGRANGRGENGHSSHGPRSVDRGDRADRGVDRDRSDRSADGHLEVARASRRSSSSDRAGSSERSSGRSAVVRPLPTAAPSKPFVVGPASFNDAQEVADKFKINVPVILNLQGVERDLARRIIDFASGLCYGLGGQMERVANQVYLLTPSDVEVSPEERRRLHERGYEA
jgi:cell division inhibitor SepF